VRIGSLFSGIGGIDLGLERAGMTVAWQCEIDPWCRSVLARHWPSVPCYHDVEDIHDETPRVDLLAGGFPCQPVSVAGRGLAQADERWLWPAFARAIRVLRPRWVLVENVPGLLARGFGDVLGDLAALGFDAEWTVFGAREVGAPHRRDRVWIVAWDRADAGGAGLEGRGPGRPTRDDGGARPLADAAGGGRERRATGGTRRHVTDRQDAGREEAERAARNGGRHGCAHVADAEGEPQRAGLRASEPRGIGRRRPGDGGGESRDVPDADGAGLEGLRRRDELRADEAGGRLPPAADWWAAEPDVGRVAHGVPARMDRLRGLGNAVVPQCAEWIGRRILEAERGVM
jgi:DNA (cytosine-5)-methyltransferase 1